MRRHSGANGCPTAYTGKDQDIRKIAEALDVRTILQGSVRRAGNRIRVTAQLINAADGYHLWSQRYDSELTDVFEVQDQIATAIAAALHLKLAPEHCRRGALQTQSSRLRSISKREASQLQNNA